MPNHYTSICLEWGGYEGRMAVKAYDSKIHALSVWQQTWYGPQGVVLGGGGSSS